MADKLRNYISQLQISEPVTNTLVSNNNSSEIIKTLFKYRQQLHIYHWQTKSYSRHIASDKLLGELTDFIDSFMEIYFGKYGRVNFSSNIDINLGNMNDNEGLKYLDEMINYYINELPTFLNPKTDTDLLNLRDDILAKTNQIKYLYTLN
jgi:hypothetical protein